MFDCFNESNISAQEFNDPGLEYVDSQGNIPKKKKSTLNPLKHYCRVSLPEVITDQGFSNLLFLKKIPILKMLIITFKSFKYKCVVYSYHIKIEELTSSLVSKIYFCSPPCK